jgi:predicted dehydrogenase
LRLTTEMRFDNGVVTKTRGDMGPDATFEMAFTVVGERGTMKVNQPLVPQIGHSIEVTIDGKTTTQTTDRRATYGYQLDAFIAAVQEGAPLLTDADDGVKQMRLIDRCYDAAGMKRRGL